MTTEGGQTSKELNEIQLKKRNADRAAADGRLKLNADRAALDQERSDWQKAKDKADLESVKSDSSKLDMVKFRIQAREREAEANRKLSEVANIRRENEILKVERETWQRQLRVESIAKETGVDPKLLAEYAELPEGKLRTLAMTVPKVTSQTTETLQIDSGRTTGGDSGPLTVERADKMTMEQYANHPSVKKRYK